MKITRRALVPGKGLQRRGEKRWDYFLVTIGDADGIGETVAEAITDARHEYRMFKDSAESGYCMKGRFHK